MSDRARRRPWQPDGTEGRVVVAAADMTSSDLVRDLFNRCRRMLRQGARHVVIDLQEVKSADTKLVACLVVLHRMARSASARLEICLSSAVLEVARICRVEWLWQELAPDDTTNVVPRAGFTWPPSERCGACPSARAS